ncbi:MAG: hypothetical protein WD534_14705 [Phycisphaeraceae bacterium]
MTATPSPIPPPAPSPPPPDRDAEHLRLLAIFHYVVGGLSIVLAFCPSIYLVMGLAMLFAGDEFKDANTGEPMPREAQLAFGFVLTLLPLIFMIAGWTLGGLLIAAGRFLQEQRRWLFCMIVAAASCLFMPLGTVLGVFTIIVLNRDTVRARFNHAATPATAPQGR